MAAGKYSTSPDCSDGADASSAPSEFLAEFLSAIMRRQYAEALKYCQLILQYEPHNATAQGFYPLLRHKLHARAGDETSSSDDTSSKRGGVFQSQLRQGAGADADADADDAASGSDCSSLELDTSASSPAGAERGSWRWDSGGERSDHDDNGNPPAPAAAAAPAPAAPAPADDADADADAENDNAACALHNGHAKSAAESSPLRRLRAHFACTIK